MSKLSELTIGFPIYKKPKNLIKQLDLINESKAKNLSIIIGDNGNNKFKYEFFKKKYPHLDITYFDHSHNIGHINNFIYLLSASNSKYFMWMADDDLHRKNFIIKLLSKIKSDRYAVSVMSNYDISFNGKVKKIHLLTSNYLSDVFFILNPLPFFKNKKNYLKIFIYGIHNTDKLKEVINNQKWINERDVLAMLRSKGRFVVVNEFLFVKNVSNPHTNNLDDDYWEKFKERGSFEWLVSFLDKLKKLKITILKKIMLFALCLTIFIIYYLRKLK